MHELAVSTPEHIFPLRLLKVACIKIEILIASETWIIMEGKKKKKGRRKKKNAQERLGVHLFLKDRAVEEKSQC